MIEKNIKIFYAYSDHNGEEYFDNNLREKLIEAKCEIANIDVQDEKFLIKNINKAIDECDMFICNITPDAKIFTVTNSTEPPFLFQNPNVCYEYAYAHAKHKSMIFLLNKSKNKDYNYKIPAILNGIQYFDYSNNEEGVITDVIETVQTIVNKKKEIDEKNQNVSNYNIELSQSFIEAINLMCDINITSYYVATDKCKKRAYIFLEGYKTTHLRFIDIMKRTLYSSSKNQEKDLSAIQNINDELKHLELIAYLHWFK